MTKELEKRFKKFPLYSQDGKGDEAMVKAIETAYKMAM